MMSSFKPDCQYDNEVSNNAESAKNRPENNQIVSSTVTIY